MAPAQKKIRSDMLRIDTDAVLSCALLRDVKPISRRIELTRRRKGGLPVENTDWFRSSTAVETAENRRMRAIAQASERVHKLLITPLTYRYDEFKSSTGKNPFHRFLAPTNALIQFNTRKIYIVDKFLTGSTKSANSSVDIHRSIIHIAENFPKNFPGTCHADGRSSVAVPGSAMSPSPPWENRYP